MKEQEVPQLKTEIARLNQIITVLLKQNALLEHENAILKSADASGTRSYTHVNNEAGITTDFYSIEKSGDGITTNNYTDDKTVDGIITRSYAIPKSGDGITEHSYTHVNSKDGITTRSVALPQTITATHEAVTKLSGILKTSGYNKVENTTIINAARLLIHFYNKGEGGHPELRHITGLSKGGNAKFISSLKKRGLIQRTAYRQFAVSGYALQLMQRALG